MLVAKRIIVVGMIAQTVYKINRRIIFFTVLLLPRFYDNLTELHPPLKSVGHNLSDTPTAHKYSGKQKQKQSPPGLPRQSGRDR